MNRYLLEDTSNINNLCIVEADTPEQAVDCHMNDANVRDTTFIVYDLKWSEGEFGLAPRRIERIYRAVKAEPVNSTKMPNMDAPAFACESQTDRAARGALLPVIPQPKSMAQLMDEERTKQHQNKEDDIPF